MAFTPGAVSARSLGRGFEGVVGTSGSRRGLVSQRDTTAGHPPPLTVHLIPMNGEGGYRLCGFVWLTGRGLGIFPFVVVPHFPVLHHAWNARKRTFLENPFGWNAWNARNARNVRNAQECSECSGMLGMLEECLRNACHSACAVSNPAESGDPGRSRAAARALRFLWSLGALLAPHGHPGTRFCGHRPVGVHSGAPGVAQHFFGKIGGEAAPLGIPGERKGGGGGMQKRRCPRPARDRSNVRPATAFVSLRTCRVI
eukprot:gene15826-biopygen17212